MRSLSFDTGPIISFALNGLLWILEPLKKRFGGEFIITPAVQKELVDKPMKGKKFEFEALRVRHEIDRGVLTLLDDDRIREGGDDFIELCNSTFSAMGRDIRIVHPGEAEAVAAAIIRKSDAFVVDERTTRLLIEDPQKVAERLKKKLHTDIKIDEDRIRKIRDMTKGIFVIRSVELITVAFQLGILDMYIPDGDKDKLLESLLWSMKLSGCSVGEKEIRRIQKIVT